MDRANATIIDFISFGASISFVLYKISSNRVGKNRQVTRESCNTNSIVRDCTISAPGKALVAGGYLVLEYPNVGVTIASSSCFHSTIRLLPVFDASQRESLEIVIESPQFYSTCEYKYIIGSGILRCISSAVNPFIEKCLLLTLGYARNFYGSEVFVRLISDIAARGKLGIKLRADNDFYSQISELNKKNLPLLSSSLRSLPRFLPCPKDADGNLQVCKTGMGSSAALATSLVGALLHSLRVVDLPAGSPCAGRHANDEKGGREYKPSGAGAGAGAGADSHAECLRIVHNVSQLAHATAQGKIGSGFDVAAAVYGSQVYRRFDGVGLQPCMDLTFTDATSLDDECRTLRAAVDSQTLWAQLSVSPLSLPPGLDIVMGDICGGSSSTSMAKEVLRWRRAGGPDVDRIWTGLANKNQLIAKLFVDLNDLAEINPASYMDALRQSAATTASSWSALLRDRNDNRDVFQRSVTSLMALREAFCDARSLLKEMGIKAGVDIEPDCQTHLANDTQELSGVLCSGVPGAGGVDAIFAITLSAAGRDVVENMWSNRHSHGVVCPLLLTAANGLGAGVAANPDICW